MPLRHDRRRRVLADELLNFAASNAEAPAKTVPTGETLRYAPAARRESQPRLCDLVPRHPLSMLLVFGMALVPVAGVLVVSQFVDDLARHVPRAALAAFEPAAPHGVVTWLTSLFLLVNVNVALLIYSLRRHRVDDYYGRYRIWLGVAAASLLASLEVSTGAAGLLAALLAPLTVRCRLPAEYGLPVVLMLAGGYLAIRLLVEVYRSRLALISLVLALSCLGTLMLGMPSWNTLLPGESNVLLRSALKLCGCLLLPTATLLFARHVLLDIEGKVPQRAGKFRKSAKVKHQVTHGGRTTDLSTVANASSVGATQWIDPPQKLKPALTPRSDLTSAGQSSGSINGKLATSNRPSTQATAGSADAIDDDNDRDMRHLSRAERKRLKREAKLARRAEAA